MSLVTAYRLTKSRNANSAFTGEGARLYGGRWSPPGLPIVYLADSLPLAAMEVLVHLERAAALDAFVYFSVHFDDSLLLLLDDVDLPADWSSHPEPVMTRAIGEAWGSEAASLLLRVRSAVVPESYNYLLNPRHPEMGRLTISGPQQFSFDPRLG